MAAVGIAAAVVAKAEPMFSPAAVAAVKAALVVVKAVAAAIAIVGIVTAPVVTTPRAAVIIPRVGRVTEIVIATGTAIVMAVAIEAEIVIATEIATATAIAIEIYMSIALRALTTTRITATMAIAPAPTSVVTGTASSPARTMRAEDRAMIRSVRTFTGKAPPASSLFSAPEALTNRLIATASCVAMMKATDATKCTGAFADSGALASIQD